MRRGSAVVVALVLAGCLVAGSGAKSSSSAAAKRCIVTASGALGGNAGGVAGGVAQKDGAKASLSVFCNMLARSVKIKIPGHAIAMSTFVHALPGGCSQAGDTVTCSLSTAQQKIGLQYGGWKDSFAWKFTPTDPTSTNTYDGSCHVPLSVTLATGATTYSQKTQTVCEYARGDALH
jgi:hypothetical protein